MTATTRISYGQALTEALRMEMHRDAAVVCVGTSVGSPVFAELEVGFGPERVVRIEPHTRPVSVAAGMAGRGLRVVCEARACDLGSDVLAPLAEIGDDATVVVRVLEGGPENTGRAAALEGRLLDTPAASIAAPATPADAKGLLSAAIRASGAACLLESEALYESVGDVEEGGLLVQMGSATLDARGNRITVVAYGLGARIAAQAAVAGELDAEVIDLRSIRPLDAETIVASVGRTGKVAIIEPPGGGRVSGEVARLLLSEAFEYLDGPLARIELPGCAGDEEGSEEAAARVAAEINELISY